MMVEMAFMPSGMMMEESMMQNKLMPDSDDQTVMSNSSVYCQIKAAAQDGSEERSYCSSCVAHCGSVAIITQPYEFSNTNRFTFESNYRFWKTPPTYSRLLKPPKFV